MTDALARYLRPQLLVMLVLFMGAAIAGVALLPGDAERVAMLERDGSNERALSLLEQRYAAGDRSQRTVFQLERLYAHFGNLTKARSMLEELAAARPRDHMLQRRLVTFYRDIQDTEAYLSALSRVVTRRYSESACHELISGLRLIGHFAREREAIERCRQKGYRQPSDIVRLAELEAANGDVKQAGLLLRKLDDLGRLEGDRERLTLVSLLLDGNERREVVQRSVSWVKKDRNTGFSASLVAMLSRRDAGDMAIEIARDAGQLGDGLSLSVAEMMLDRDQVSAARAYLRGWLQHTRFIDRDLTERFVSVAIDAEDPELALDAARRYGLSGLSEPKLIAIAEALAATGRRSEFESVRSVLAADAIVAHPLLAATVELNRGEASASRELLDKVSVDALDRWRLALWARLMRDSGAEAAANARLRELGVTTAALPDAQSVRRRNRRAIRLFARPPVASQAQAASARRERRNEEAAVESRRSRKLHVLRVASMKRLKSARSRYSSYRPGGVAGRPQPIARPVAQAQQRN